MNIGIIGSGNVAWHLAQAATHAGYKLAYICGRNVVSVPQLALEFDTQPLYDIQHLPETDFCFLCVNDDAIEEIIPFIRLKETMMVHTSGLKPMQALSSFKHYGVSWPPISLTHHVATDFNKLPICIEANSPESLERLRQFIVPISNHLYETDSAHRATLHLAAVFANNFTNLLYSYAEQLCNRNGLDFDLLKPLIIQTAMKIDQASPADMQTGPARRHDEDTIEKHIQLLHEHPELLEVYRLMTHNIQKQYH